MAPDRPQEEREQGFEQARLAYLQALQGDPNYLPAQLGLARCYLGLNDLTRAQSAYERALAMSPNNAVVWHDLSVVYLRQKNWKTALSCLDKAISNDPDNRKYQNTMGWVLARAGREEESFTCFNRLYGPVQAHCNLAKMLHHNHQTESAHRHLQAALQQDPQAEEAVALMAKLNSPEISAPATTALKPGNGQDLPPQVEPVQTVIYQQPAAPAPSAPSQPLTPDAGEPRPFPDPEVKPFPLPGASSGQPTANTSEPEAGRIGPVQLLPATPLPR